MSITALVTGALLDIAKKQALTVGKKVVHEWVQSDKKIGKIICYRKQQGYNNVLLFIHGFNGSPTETFGATPEMLAADEKMDGWDIFSIGYSSDIFPTIGRGIWSANPDITKIAKYLNTLIDNVFYDYNRIAIVAHSMGGLAAQRAILNITADNRNKVTHLMLFGTPSAGLRKAFWFRFWNLQVHDLSDDSDFIKKLRADWSARYNGNYPFDFKTVAGSKDEFVPVKSSLKPFDDRFQEMIEGNHITMIKPLDNTDVLHQSFLLILNRLTNIDTVLIGSSEEKNIVLGQYTTIIAKYFPKFETIGLKELTYLVFALECCGRKDDALIVLDKHPLARTNSDTLGIIGGRYKRKYLLDGEQADLDKSFEYYTRAYELAKKIDAPIDRRKQIFYQTINLAFLSIVSMKEGDMNMYASLALENCEENSEDMWEQATIAEASMYLKDRAKAEKFYNLAAKSAGKKGIRDKQSMYSNAFYGYQAMVKNNNVDAPFLQMLDQVLLG